MSLLFLSSAIIFNSHSVRAASQNPCPELTGEYFCVFKNNDYSPLKVKQWVKQEQKGITFYSFDYTAIAGDPEIIRASPTGERDSSGWITRCKDQKLVSVPSDYSRMQEIYLNKDHVMTFVMNGKVSQICPGKESTQARRLRH